MPINQSKRYITLYHLHLDRFQRRILNNRFKSKFTKKNSLLSLYKSLQLIKKYSHNGIVSSIERLSKNVAFLTVV